ncbi:MAG TPA: signal peptidase I [Fimbriimonadaceae bacterium]
MQPLFAQEQTKDWSNVVDQLARTPLSKVIAFVAICTLVRLILAPLIARVPAEKRGFGHGLLRFVNEALDAVVYAGVFVFLLIRPFCIQAFKIPSGSMIPTLLEGDFIVANKAVFRYSDPQINNIVVFRPPDWACEPGQVDADGQVNVDFIKRCVGRPGDIVEVKNHILYRNGVAVREPYLSDPMDDDFKLVKYKPAPGVAPDSAQSTYWPLKINGDYVNTNDRLTAKPYLLNDMREENKVRNLPNARIPKGYYLFMGDNRNYSFDGRSWGLVQRDAIIGRSEFIWLPLKRIGKTR